MYIRTKSSKPFQDIATKPVIKNSLMRMTSGIGHMIRHFYQMAIYQFMTMGITDQFLHPIISQDAQNINQIMIIKQSKLYGSTNLTNFVIIQAVVADYQMAIRLQHKQTVLIITQKIWTKIKKTLGSTTLLKQILTLIMLIYQKYHGQIKIKFIE